MDCREVSSVKLRDWARRVPTCLKSETELDLCFYIILIFHNWVISIYWALISIDKSIVVWGHTLGSFPPPPQVVSVTGSPCDLPVSPFRIDVPSFLLSPHSSHCPNLLFSGKIQRGGTSNCWTLGSWVGMELGPLPKPVPPPPPAVLTTLSLTLEICRMAGRRESYPR